MLLCFFLIQSFKIEDVTLSVLSKNRATEQAQKNYQHKSFSPFHTAPLHNMTVGENFLMTLWPSHSTEAITVCTHSTSDVIWLHRRRIMVTLDQNVARREYISRSLCQRNHTWTRHGQRWSGEFFGIGSLSQKLCEANKPSKYIIGAYEVLIAVVWPLT